MKWSMFKSTHTKLFEATESTSKYKGVSWNEKRSLWQTKFDVNGKVKTFYFDSEFDAAEKLNQLCNKMRIPTQVTQHPDICDFSNQQVTNIQITSSLVRFFAF